MPPSAKTAESQRQGVGYRQTGESAGSIERIVRAQRNS